MNDPASTLRQIRTRIEHAAPGRAVALVAVSKTRDAEEIRALARAGQVAFGENYVQEALAKQQALAGLSLEWHHIGPLQSNKCRDLAAHFDWLQTLDRIKLVPTLQRHCRDAGIRLNVLIQVNVDGERTKAGCAPDAVGEIAQAVAEADCLRLRGLMAIPEPVPDPGRRRASFRRMRAMFETLQAGHDGIDTLSMGMSDDFELALAEGSTMVRIGTALFGPRPAATRR